MNQLTEFLTQTTSLLNAEGEGEAQSRPAQTATDRRRQSARPTRVPPHAEREPEAIASRPGATPSERYLRRVHTRVRDARSLVEDRVTDLIEDRPGATNFTDLLNSDHPGNPFRSFIQDNNRQAKRRKLDHAAEQASEYDGFKYGYKGQVVRGRLRMQVVSCDGGEYDRDSSLYRVQNVLSNDKSVYCSQTGSCNLLLKHIGEAPFCLEKVVIRAPDRGFTAPVQEGLIFVSMSPDKLISGTSAYEIEYNSETSDSSPTDRHGRPSPSVSPVPNPFRPGQVVGSEDLLSFEEAIGDNAVWERSRQALRERVENLRVRVRARQHQQTQNSQPYSQDDDDAGNECPYHIEEGDSNAAGVSAPTPPPFTTTTESEPEDAEGEAMPSAAIMADRLRRESRYRSEGEEDDEDDRDELMQHPLASFRRSNRLDDVRLQSFRERAQRWREMRRSFEPIRATRLRTPSRIEPKQQPEAAAEELIQPQARFFIARHKNKITVKFHPAM